VRQERLRDQVGRNKGVPFTPREENKQTKTGSQKKAMDKLPDYAEID